MNYITVLILHTAYSTYKVCKRQTFFFSFFFSINISAGVNFNKPTTVMRHVARKYFHRKQYLWTPYLLCASRTWSAFRHEKALGLVAPCKVFFLLFHVMDSLLFSSDPSPRRCLVTSLKWDTNGCLYNFCFIWVLVWEHGTRTT